MALATERMGGGMSAGEAKAAGGLPVTLVVTGASSSQALAAPIKASNVIFSGGDGTKSASLPDGENGDMVQCFNNSGSTVPVFPPVGGAICVPGTGLGSANASYAHTTYASVIYTCQNAATQQWMVNKSA